MNQSEREKLQALIENSFYSYAELTEEQKIRFAAYQVFDMPKKASSKLEAFIDRLIELGEWGVTGMVIATSFSGGEIHDLAERRQNEWLTLVKDWKERKE